ncbi:unnamed protein product [Heligmosomoides polygyrus]|uniref:Uncharacterized protein n=1 Tax=Heligmosomoides polygyrus TaxID=6339 RepID=A0A183FMB9_HELPZ|nr:unnamed protein product [Heligmosomoides polygyrus]
MLDILFLLYFFSTPPTHRLLYKFISRIIYSYVNIVEAKIKRKYENVKTEKMGHTELDLLTVVGELFVPDSSQSSSATTAWEQPSTPTVAETGYQPMRERWSKNRISIGERQPN